MTKRRDTRTGGRPASSGVIPGQFALSVGRPDHPAPDGWRWTLLTDVARLETGHTPSRRRSEYWDGDIPWIGIKDATSNHGRIIDRTYQYTNELGISNSSARVLPTNTVCLSRTASVGYVVVMGKPMATSQDFVNWVCTDAIDYRFLKYVLLAEREAFLRFASGTTHQTIYFPEVKAFHVCLPPLPEQRAIVHILGTLDDKIELNQWMNETLEAMARALFKSWFVDFDPVRAKVEGRDPGLPKSVVDLFSNSLEDSNLGKIPKGWRASVLGKEVTRYGGQIQTGPFGSQLHASDYVADGVPVVMPKDLLHRRVSTQSIARVRLSDAERLSRHRLRDGDIVYSRRGDVGRHGLVRSREAGWLCGTGCLLVRLGPKWPSTLFTSLALDRPETRAWIAQHAIGATMPNLNTGILAGVPIVIPPETVLRIFNRVALPLADRVIASDAQTETLADLRDTLLPRLISGDLRLKDAEKFIERTI